MSQPENGLQQDILKAYFWIRTGMAFLASAFPLFLGSFGWLCYGVPLQHSMSAYYHAAPWQQAGVGGDAGAGPMRNWFVGILFVEAAFFILYQGFSKLEDWMFNIAGLFAAGVALNPMSWPEVPGPFSFFSFSWHYLCAVCLFVCIGIVAIFLAGNTLHLMKNPAREERYRRKYIIAGVFMGTSPFVAWWVTSWTGTQSYATLCVECIGLWSFSAYWFIKNCELQATSAEEELALKQLQATRGRPHVVPPASYLERLFLRTPQRMQSLAHSRAPEDWISLGFLVPCIFAAILAVLIVAGQSGPRVTADLIRLLIGWGGIVGMGFAALLVLANKR